MKEISEVIVVILEQQSSRKLGWEGDLLKIAYFRNSLESNLMKLNWKSGERNTQHHWGKQIFSILPINVTCRIILD